MSYLTRIDALCDATHIGLADGSSVRTPNGAKRVEFLAPGDMIVTRTSGLMPLTEIRRIKVSAAELRADPSCAPIRLTPRALGPMMPARMLRLAPDQTVSVPGHLLSEEAPAATVSLRARDLPDHLDGCIVDVSTQIVTYHQLVFEGIQRLMAEGVIIESASPSPERTERRAAAPLSMVAH